MKKHLIVSSLFFLVATGLNAQLSDQSVARKWNELLIESIRNDFARPPVHARNLYHTAIAMYDAWAIYDDHADTYLLGKTVNGFTCPFEGIPEPEDKQAAREKAMSFAAYLLLSNRFFYSPGWESSLASYRNLMDSLGYDRFDVSLDYSEGDAAALGSHIAKCIIDYGLQDGSNEIFNYENLFYQPVNPSLLPSLSGNPNLTDPNRWQPLTFDFFVDQSGNIFPGATPAFQSPEWGQVEGFALGEPDPNPVIRDGFTYQTYHDPGPPPYLDTINQSGLSELYKWGFIMVPVWGSHLDPGDGVIWDISPASIGNLSALPDSFAAYPQHYNFLEGGEYNSPGYTLNPVTGKPYEPQLVPRGDYARVLAEFWADGPDSETPPGHWFTILNYVNDQPDLVRKYKGEGEELDPLEWDVKAYLTLGATVHDAAISAWGVKGKYDYIRPISVVRWLADKGQSTNPSDLSYDPNGIPLVPGLIELVKEGDPLAGEAGEQVGKIKLYTWRGPDYIEDPEVDDAGVGWILAENWWPFQRPTFITPPFAGYVSGHSTFSRAAAEALTYFTGSPYFPGGMGEFVAKKNEFLHFEEGPSVDVHLQWASYRDASDQTSLSRIWGGIHPPQDDIPGRLMGVEVGQAAAKKAELLFNAGSTSASEIRKDPFVAKIYPNPVVSGEMLSLELPQNESAGESRYQLQITDLQGKLHYSSLVESRLKNLYLQLPDMEPGYYTVQIKGKQTVAIGKLLVAK